jgi:hypothetical protein
MAVVVQRGAANPARVWIDTEEKICDNSLVVHQIEEMWWQNRGPPGRHQTP